LSAVTTSQPKAVKEVHPNKLVGKASFYSKAGCLGCGEKQITASGEPFDEDKMTLACNQLPLKKSVKITNTRNGLTVIARVNDRGGFEKYNRIADLSLAAAKAIDLRTDKDDIIIEVID